MKMSFIILPNIVLLFTTFALQVRSQVQVQSPLLVVDAGRQEPHRIAIIGAGSAGSSTAFHLAKFHNETGLNIPIEIDIFESSDYIGGRSTTIDALDDPRYPTELGASIFVKVNHILYNFSREFQLSSRDKASTATGSMYEAGIWDGTSFPFTIPVDDSDGSSWSGYFGGIWDIAKLLWSYGLSPIWTKQAKDAALNSFFKWYDEYLPIASLTKFTSAVGLSEYTGITGQAALLKHSVSEKFAREIVQSSTRVNYAQNLNNIHGLETMVCMATEGAMSISGGNWQMFAEAVKRSEATLHLNSTVTHVSRTHKGTYKIQTTNQTASTDHNPQKEYSAVILAAPYQFANIIFTPPLPKNTVPEKIDYVTLYVTLFTSPFRPSPHFFNVKSASEIPNGIYSTLPLPLPDAGSEPNPLRGADAVGPAKFWSISTLRVLNPQTDSFTSDSTLLTNSNLTHLTQPQYLYKVFSPNPLTATLLSSIFAFNYTRPSTSSTTNTSPNSDPITNLPRSQIPWSHTKIWQSYPYLPPKLDFSALKLSGANTDAFNTQTKVQSEADDAFGVYYTSGVESFISTMETSALMGMNVARIIVDGLGKVESQGQSQGQEAS